MCLAIHTTSISQFAATFNDARNRARSLRSRIAPDRACLRRSEWLARFGASSYPELPGLTRTTWRYWTTDLFHPRPHDREWPGLSGWCNPYEAAPRRAETGSRLGVIIEVSSPFWPITALAISMTSGAAGLSPFVDSFNPAVQRIYPHQYLKL
jgi:hypothetical protein